ncbi:Murein hydrolase activator NlpD precursor [Vibrio thalassae]|uniref:Murein hydrolase activator NlpD n=2 Tax=Vibrio thalassae TaxID=1243014 RepID=A0A240EFY0_9VIBR|nr:Murein hydrolase activator NlpD precursor [Vibrio thalassae]
MLSSTLVGCTGHSPAPVSNLGGKYDNVSRGSYRGSYYEVQKGDTLYFIAYKTDKDVKDLIRLNNLRTPYTIHPGQRLNLWRPVYTPPAYGGAGEVATASAATAAASSTTAQTKPSSSQSSKAKANSSSTQNSQKTATNKVDQSKPKEYGESKGKQNVNNTKPNTAKQSTAQAKPKPPSSTNGKVTSWQWPTKGRVTKNFSAGDQGNKGIDIAGQRGQAIVATAKGTVVYSGNALRGYGNLVIVKHNDNYLSAYAHNDRLLVSEGQSVKAGQKIATMGSSGTNSVRLHFEIRYQGKSVNPKRYLP